MSENDSSEIIGNKRKRVYHSKSNENKSKQKIISKKYKLGKKSKKKSPQINIIKPKNAKNPYLFNSPNINDNNFNENIPQDEDSEMKKDDSVQENSLGQLTKNFINYIKKTGRKSININDLVNELSVKKRRIYDITNVLQGMNYLQKSGKNEIVWTKNISNKSKSKKKPSSTKKVNNKPKINIEELQKEKNELDNDIEKFKAEFNSIAKKGDFLRYGYITLDDIRRLSINTKVDLIVIKAAKGTVMNVIDKNDIKQAYNSAKNLMENNEMKSNDSLLNILNKSNQLIFTCPENLGINIYEINNGNINEIKTNNNNIFNNNENKIPGPKFFETNNKTPTLKQNTLPLFNKQNQNIFSNNHPIINSNIPEQKYPSATEKGNLETMQHNFMVNNKQNNISVSYATKEPKIKNYNYKNQIIYPNQNNINNNLQEEKFSYTANISNFNNGK